MTSMRRSPARGIPTTWLFTPGVDPAHFDVAAHVGADVAILDLEDAVAPGDKDRARDLVVEHLAAHRESGSTVRYAVRINTPGSVAGLRDLLTIAEHRLTPDHVIVPKVDSAATIDMIAEVFDGAGVITNLVAMIETARAATTITDILGDAQNPIAALMFGAADMAGDLGAEPGTPVVDQTRSTILRAAAAAGVPAIDSPWFDVHDTTGLTEDVAAAVRNGFTAKAAIHPAQVATINAGFAPTADQITWATTVVETAARGVGTVDGQMIDEAVARRARRILLRAEQ